MSKGKELIADWWRSGNLAALAGIVLLGALIYGHTLNAPWYLDDTNAILENPTVHRIQEALADMLSGRGPANLTLALNYHFGGTNVAGYHLVNIAIHLATSWLVFLLLKRVFRGGLLLPLGGALIFVSHPLQTQAVTYLVQRMTSMAALFFFLALYLYLLARESWDGEEGRAPLGHWIYYGAALASGALAVLTKQNAAVLPVAIGMFELYFLAEGRAVDWRRLALRLAPFCLLPLLLAAKSLLFPMLSEGSINAVGGMPDLVHLKNNSPLNYLVTQFSVLWLYLRLSFVPYGQALDYDFPIVADIWAVRNWIAFAGLAGLLAVAAYLRKRAPVVSFGIFWFFLALCVESSIIPLDPVFEHRLYVPMFGFALVVVWALSLLPKRAAAAGVAVVVALLAVLTWQRNALWNDPFAFLNDNLKRSPNSERVHIDLANIYLERGRPLEAQQLYERALRINPGYVYIHINLARAYAAQKEYHKAVAILEEGLRRNSNHFKLYNNLGVLYNYLGDLRRAAYLLQIGANMEPNNATVHFNLALSYDKLGMMDQAIVHYRRAIALDYGDPVPHFNLGTALHKRGDLRGGLQEFLVAYRLNPKHVGTVFNATLIYLELGDVNGAEHLAAQMRGLDPGLAAELQLRIDQVMQRGGGALR